MCLCLNYSSKWCIIYYNNIANDNAIILDYSSIDVSKLTLLNGYPSDIIVHSQDAYDINNSILGNIEKNIYLLNGEIKYNHDIIKNRRDVKAIIVGGLQE